VPPGDLDTDVTLTLYELDLPQPVHLDPGTHWLSVQSSLTDPDQWYWTERRVQAGAASMWRNPLGGLVPACTDWSPRLDCGVGSHPDQVFAISGSNVSESGCRPGPEQLCLNQGRFQVTATWRDFDGQTGDGRAVPLTADTGTFWFFDEANIELVVKVLDATGVNGHFWVFYGALSNVEFTLTVTDTVSGQVATYRNPVGTFASVGDTEALLADPPDADDVRQALEAAGLVTDRVAGDAIVDPMLVVGSFQGETGVIAALERELGCRDSLPDATFHLPVRAGNELEAPGVLVNRLRTALQALATHRIEQVTLVGHNTGGLVARAAVADEANVPDGLEVRLLTLFAPFAGLESLPSTYPDEFLADHPFIASPGALPEGVSHLKVDARLGDESDDLEGDNDTDAIFFDAQVHPAVDGDPRLTAHTVIDLSYWGIDLHHRLEDAFDAIGYPRSGCAGDQGKRASGTTAQRTFAAPAADPPFKANTVQYDPGAFRARNLVLLGPRPVTQSTTLDGDRPVTVIVRGWSQKDYARNPEAFDQENSHLFSLAGELRDAGENVFLFFYDRESQTLDQAAGRLNTALMHLYQTFMRHDITVFGHSMGGLIARRAMTRGQTVDQMGFNLLLFTVASPFAGHWAADWAPDILIRSFSGAAATQMASGGNFIRNPGRLGSRVTHIKVVTNEHSTGDDVLDVDDQENSAVDNDPRRLETYTENDGHSSIFTSEIKVRPMIRKAQERRGFKPELSGADGAVPSPGAPLHVISEWTVGDDCPHEAGTFTLTNRGTEAFTWGLEESDSNDKFNLSTSSGTVNPGQSITVRVRFECDELPADQGPFTFRANYYITLTSASGRVATRRVDVAVGVEN
jgi:alpha-beta hydrolase superfamily lysophospholipase